MNKNIEEILNEAGGGTLDNPVELSDYIVRLAHKSGEVERQIAEAEILTADKWRELRLKTKTDKEAENEIKLSDEWKTWKTLKAYGKQIDKVRSAFSKRISVLEDHIKEGI